MSDQHDRLPHPVEYDRTFVCAACPHEQNHDPIDRPSLCPACGSAYYEQLEFEYDDDDDAWEKLIDQIAHDLEHGGAQA